MYPPEKRVDSPAEPPQEPHPVRDRSLVDLGVIVCVVVLYFFLAIEVELAERLNSLTHIYENWQLDEIPLTLLVLSLGLVWFGWRRWRELNREMQIRSRVEAANRHTLAQNRRLAQQVIQLQESERRHIARELHDEIGQCCVAIKVDAALIARDAKDQPATVRSNAAHISDTADHLQRVLRGMLTRLRPTGLDDLGLASSLELLIQGWQARHGIACEFSTLGALDALDEPTTMTLYRSVQEGLTNIAKHAQASRAEVSITQTADASGAAQIRLTVTDNGVGLPPEAHSRGLGLLGMQERVSALGGHLSLNAQPGGGLRVQVVLPVLPPEGAL
jgi:two-component system sensor histidine kinase UhpB